MKKYSTPIQEVHKEAQHSALSGEGYKDPRFIPTTGYPLIDKWGLSPFMGQGAGQILTEREKGKDVPEGYEQFKPKGTILSARVQGVYYPEQKSLSGFDREDRIFWRSVISPEAKERGTTVESIQTHEIVHRAAIKSGYFASAASRLTARGNNSAMPARIPDILKRNRRFKDGYSDEGKLHYFWKKRNLEKFEPILEEAMARGYQHIAEGKDLSDEEFKERITALTSTYNITEEKIPFLTETIIQLVPSLKKDFENYLQKLEEENEKQRKKSLEKTITKKQGGGFIDSPLYLRDY